MLRQQRRLLEEFEWNKGSIKDIFGVMCSII